jgi:hypothetical protein
MAALMQNRQGIDDQLRATLYAAPALVPATPWLGSDAPAAPKVSAAYKGGAVNLKLAGGKAGSMYAIWSRYGSEWRFAVAPASRAEWAVPDDARLGAANAVVVSAVDRLGNEGKRIEVWRKG